MSDPATSDEILRAVFDAAPVGIVVVDPDGRLRRVNPIVEHMTGYAEHELIGRRFAELSHPDDLPADEAIFAEVAAGKRQAHQVERRTLGKDGRVIPARVTLSMRRDPPMVIAIIEDITHERVKELTALHGAARIMFRGDRARDDRLREIVALLPPAMQFPEIATCRITIGDDSFATDGHAATAWMLRRSFTTSDGTGAIELAYHAARPEAADGPFLREEVDLLASLAETIASALERDQAERELRRANHRLTLALGAAAMAVWEWDLTTNQVHWSPELAAMTGHTGSLDFPMGTHDDVVHPDDRPRLYHELRRIAACGGAVDAVEVRLHRPDGSWRVVSIYVQGTSDRQRVVAAVVDVSVRHALEVGLRQSQKVEALGQVAGGVAHDFANLLTVILTSVDVLRPAGAEQREVVDAIDAAARSGVTLTHQLLAFSRNAAFQPTAVDVNAIVATLEPMLQRLTRGQAKLRFELDRAAGKVWADPAQIEQVVMNLVINARDALTAGGAITVRTGVATSADVGRARLRPGTYVVLAVTDDGPGIAPELHERIFEPFFTTKDKGKGTGLGLALISNVAREWHGGVLLDTAPGAGAEFRVLLPQLS